MIGTIAIAYLLVGAIYAYSVDKRIPQEVKEKASRIDIARSIFYLIMLWPDILYVKHQKKKKKALRKYTKYED